jgi:hypothetical protein
MDHLNAKFRSVYTPECDVSIDESLMMWKGCLLWKIYSPSKRARFGTKTIELCEAKSGYVRNFVIYIGWDTIFEESLRNEPYSPKVVLQLMARLLNQEYHVIMDNWFSSTDLFHKLCSKQIDAKGTLHQNRVSLPN